MGWVFLPEKILPKEIFLFSIKNCKHKKKLYSNQIAFRELSKAKSRMTITKKELMSKLGEVIFIHNKAKSCVVTGYYNVF